VESSTSELRQSEGAPKSRISLGVRRIEPRRVGRQGRYRSIKLQELGVGVDAGLERRV
jgi:hypothetical protein